MNLPPARPLGEQLRQLPADGVAEPVHADAEGCGVTEQHQTQRWGAGPTDGGPQRQAEFRLGGPVMVPASGRRRSRAGP